MRRSGFSLVELLVAATITLVVLLAAAQVFWLIGSNVANSRGLMEASSRLRSAQFRLQADLDGMTAPLTPPLNPDHEQGYFEYIEGPGPYHPDFPAGVQPVTDGAFDSSVGDMDDVLLFTTRTNGTPFLGIWDGEPPPDNPQSQVAEVAWFVRGNKLYRRQLLVWTFRHSTPAIANFYHGNDISVHLEGGQTDHRAGWESRQKQLVANTLGDLTKRENRFAHQPLRFPHDARQWGMLGLPIMQETTSPNYPLPELGSSYGMGDLITIPGLSFTPPATVDYWVNPLAGLPVDQLQGHLTALPNGTRAGEDVILTNVIGFDVKIYDPDAPIYDLVSEPILPGDYAHKHRLNDGATPIGTGAYVDLYYTRGTSAPEDLSAFAGAGDARSGLRAGPSSAAVYCTWSTHYENDGLNQDGDETTDSMGNTVPLIDEGTDGLDNDGQFGVDDPGERETSPPYPHRAFSIQVKIRVCDPDSGQIREVTVVSKAMR